MIRLALAAFVAGSIAVAIGGGGGTPAGVDSASCIEDIYPAFAGTTLPSYLEDFECPTDPTTDGGTATVSNATEWDDCVEHASACDGDVITIGDSFSFSGGSGTVNCDDCIINAAGRTLTGVLNFASTRVQWNDGSILGNCQTGAFVTDLLLDNINCTSTTASEFNWTWGFNRLAIVNSTFFSNNSADAAWAFYMQPNHTGATGTADAGSDVDTLVDNDGGFNSRGLDVGNSMSNDTDMGAFCFITSWTDTSVECDLSEFSAGTSNTWATGNGWTIRGGPPYTGENLLIAGSWIHSGGQVTRVQDVHNIVYFDSAFGNDYGTSVLRMGHYNTALSSSALDILVSDVVMAPARNLEWNTYNVELRNNTMYHQGQNNPYNFMCHIPFGGGSEVATNNVMYCSSACPAEFDGCDGIYGACTGDSAPGSELDSLGCTGTNQNNIAWNPTTNPSFSGYGADH